MKQSPLPSPLFHTSPVQNPQAIDIWLLSEAVRLEQALQPWDFPPETAPTELGDFQGTLEACAQQLTRLTMVQGLAGDYFLVARDDIATILLVLGICQNRAVPLRGRGLSGVRQHLQSALNSARQVVDTVLPDAGPAH